MFKHLISRMSRWIVLVLIALPIAFGPQKAQAQYNDEHELFLVAQKAFEDGFYDVAIRYINQLFEDFPQTEKHIQAHLLLGQCHFFKGQYLKAYDIFNELQKYPQYKDATLYWLGETYLKGSDYEKAEKQYLKLIELYPDSIYTPQAHYSLGWCYSALNKHQKAAEAFAKLVRKFPVHQLTEDASFKLAETKYNASDYETAIEYFNNYTVKYPKARRHAQAYFYIAESHYFLENFLTAITYYAKTAESAYDKKLALMSKVNLGWSYLKLQKYKLSQQYFDEAYTYAKSNNILSDDVFLGQATYHAETGDNKKAIGSYKELIEKFPDSERIIEAHLGLANTYYQTKDYSQAIRNYQIIISKLMNDHSKKEILEKAFFGLAWAHLKSGDIDAAVESFETIKNTTANKTVKISAMTQIGDAYQDVGEYEKAVEFYDKILSEFADSPYTDYVQYRQGIALLKMEKIEAATMSFQSLQRNFPTSKYLNDVDYYLAVAYFKKEDWITSRKYIDSFIDNLPHSNKFLAEARYILALSHYNLRDFKDSLLVFEKIIQDHPDESALIENAELYIAKNQYELGRTDEALTKFKDVSERYKKSKAAQEALMWLGDHYLETSDFKNAIVYYKKYIRRFPGSDKLNLIYFELGRAHQAQQEYDAAVKAYKHIERKADPVLYERARLAIADIFAMDLDANAAVETYQNIIEDTPEFKRNAYIKIAQIHTNTKNYVKSIAAYQQAIAAKSTVKDISNAELQFLIADGYQLLNQLDHAVDEYLKVSYLYPNETPWVIKSYLRLARIFEDNEQWEDARITYSKILKYELDEAKYAQERLDWIEENLQ